MMIMTNYATQKAVIPNDYRFHNRIYRRSMVWSHVISITGSRKGQQMTNEEAIKRIKEFGLYHAIDDLPHSMKTVEAFDMAIEALSERPKGEWKTTVTGQPYCSNCEYVFGEDEEFSPFWNYCPMCGARMKGGADMRGNIK